MDHIYPEAIWEGCLLGFGLAFLIGPAFFALLQASIDYGVEVAVWLALGVVFSDCVLMGLSCFLLQELNQIPYFHTGLALAGGVVLIFSGFSLILRPVQRGEKYSIGLRDIWHLFRKGFSINTFNPFPWMFWLSTSALVANGVGKNNGLAAFLFFASAAVTVFLTDAAKAYGAQFLLRFLTPSILKKFRWISGSSLVGFGIRLMVFGIIGK